jgi:hypothetical protein
MATRAELEALARYYATQAGIDPNIFVRQIQRESGFDPNAHNRLSDASGIAQIIPRWHPGVNPYDPGAALQYAANLMASYIRKFGDYTKALSAYNAGPNGNWDNPETNAYVADILQGTSPVTSPLTEEPAASTASTGASPQTNKGCASFASSTAVLVPLIVVILWQLIANS